MVIRWDVRLPVLRELRSLVARHDVELRQLVAQAARAGARTQDIADAVGVSRSTLWRRYRAELRREGAAD
ncbi:MAG: helix-turn-helix domain-containing protein [Solirubrobacteraceae bacterium]